MDASTPTLVDCKFNRNSTLLGGALYWESSTRPTVTACLFEENQANYGGAVFTSSNAASSLVNCTLANNSAALDGGAVYSNGGGLLTLDRCVLVSNSASSRGGAAFSTGAISIDHCTLYGNWTGGAGGGVMVESGTASLENTIIAFGPDGEAVACGGGTATLSCCDIYANIEGDWVGCIAEQVGVNDNFSANPLFCDAENRNFTIHGTSPCAPSNSPGNCGLIGALPVACGVTDVAESAPLVGNRLTVKPNPVCGPNAAEFSFDVASAAVEIYDLQGRLIQMLIPEDRRAVWLPDASVPRGIYFARLRGTAVAEVVKFAVIR